MEGKKEFYQKVEEALKSKGYDYYDGDRDIPGKGRQHAKNLILSPSKATKFLSER